MSRISISVGPGQYGDLIVDILANSGQLNQAFSSFPQLAVEEFGSNAKPKKVSKAFGALQKAVWTTWRRLPYYGEFQTPTGYLLPLADKWMASQLEPCDLYIGWLQVGLAGMKKAKRFGARTICEHQMASVWKWTELMTDEYQEWGKGRKGFHSLFSDKQVATIEEEYEEADLINVLSTYSRDSFTEFGFNKDKIIVTPFGVDTDHFNQSGARRISGKLRVLFVGRLEILKGVQYLLAALSKISSKEIELQFVGPILPEIDSILNQFKDSRIEILGPVDRAQLPGLYQNADVLVFPTINDSFGLVVLEAMACGLPVIVTEHSCGADVVKDGVEGFVIPIRNSEAIRDKIEYFLDNRETVSVMGAEARKTIMKNFTFAHYRERYLRMCSGGLQGARK